MRHLVEEGRSRNFGSFEGKVENQRSTMDKALIADAVQEVHTRTLTCPAPLVERED